MPLNLRQKLAQVRRKIHNVEKRGKNTFQNYDYAMASDMAGLLGNALAEIGVIVARRSLDIKRSEIEKPNNKGMETRIEISCEYGFLDTDSAEELWQPAYGEGRDSGDKAAYKAFTGALKYFLIQTFMLATGDDPEADDEPDARGAAPPRGHGDHGEKRGHLLMQVYGNPLLQGEAETDSTKPGPKFIDQKQMALLHAKAKDVLGMEHDDLHKLAGVEHLTEIPADQLDPLLLKIDDLGKALVGIDEANALVKEITDKQIDPAKVLTFFKKEAFEHFNIADYNRALRIVRARKAPKGAEV